MPYIFGQGWVDDAAPAAAPSLASIANGLSPQRSYGGPSGLDLTPLQESEWQAANAQSRAAPAPQGSIKYGEDGNPLWAYVPGVGYVAGQNWGSQSGDTFSRANFQDQANQDYGQQTQQQIANTGQYILGSATPFYNQVGDRSALDSWLKTQDPALGRWFGDETSGGLNTWGSPTDSSVGTPSIVTSKMPKEESAWTSFMGGEGKPWWGFSPAAAVGGAIGGVVAGAGGAMGAGTSAIGGVEGAGGVAGSLTAAGGSVQPSLWTTLTNTFNGGGTGPTGGLGDIIENAGNFTGGADLGGISPLEGGGGMDFDLNDIIEEFGNFTGGGAGGGSGIDMSGIPDFSRDIVDASGNLLQGGGKSISDVLSALTQKVGPTVAKSLFSRFMSGDASALDVLGAAAPGLISEFFKNQQANQLSGSLQKIADQARTDRQPFLDYAKNTLAGGPDAYAAGAGSQALKGVLAKLSVQGNPFGNPTSLGIATDSALNNWGNDWRQAANIGLGGNYSQLATNAATAGAPTSGAGFGDAMASVFTPQKNSLADLLKSLQMGGLA